MKRLVQIKYTQFTEIFEASIDSANISSEVTPLNVELKEILPYPKTHSEFINLDLSTDFRTNYADFPFENGDLSIIQVGNVFIVASHTGEHIHWLKFDTSQLLSYLIKNPLLDEILPFINEDKHIFINSLLSDFIRNDYSFNEINKKIKFCKVAVLLSFIKDYLKADFKRVLFDETLLGDIEIENIPMSLRFSDKKVLSVAKIDNLSKVIVALEKSGEINTKFKFEPRVYFVNNTDGANKVKLILNENGLKFDYEVLPQKNYIFDLGEKEYIMEFGKITSQKVTGRVCVYNGDHRDLMIS